MENITGTWKGYYAFDSPGITALREFDRTIFQIDIQTRLGGRFSGMVQDDVHTGGMSAKGKIEGELDGGFVWFKKYMPRHEVILPDGTFETRNKKHPVIHYSGEYFPLEKKMRGTWKIKPRLFFFHRKLYIGKKTTGTWEMVMETV